MDEANDTSSETKPPDIAAKYENHIVSFDTNIIRQYYEEGLGWMDDLIHQIILRHKSMGMLHISNTAKGELERQKPEKWTGWNNERIKVICDDDYCKKFNHVRLSEPITPTEHVIRKLNEIWNSSPGKVEKWRDEKPAGDDEMPISDKDVYIWNEVCIVRQRNPDNELTFFSMDKDFTYFIMELKEKFDINVARPEELFDDVKDEWHVHDPRPKECDLCEFYDNPEDIPVLITENETQAAPSDSLNDE